MSSPKNASGEKPLKSMNPMYSMKGHYYQGAFQAETHPSGQIVKYSPAQLNQLLWNMPDCSSHSAENVLNSAIAGFSIWKKTSLKDRCEYLLKYKEQLLKRHEEIALALAWETGKPLWEAKTEAQGLAAKVDVTIQESLPRIQHKTLNNVLPGLTGHFIYRPIGPALIIGPFNFPCHLANGQIVSALIAGNSIIFKPSEKTAYAPQIMMECLHDAGFPMGVVNLLQGSGRVMNEVISSSKLRAIYFTGSKEVGAKIQRTVADHFYKMTALEMGGKNTTIIHDGANMEHTLAELINACFLTAGQRCTSTSLIAVNRKIYHAFLPQFIALAHRISVGHPLEQTPFMGPLIDESAEKLYAQFQALAISEGGHPLMPATKLKLAHEGYYWSPSVFVFEQAFQGQSFLTKEIFAPNVTVVPYDDIEEAIHLANASEYGLAAAVFTQDQKIYEHCLSEIEVGIFNLNRSTVGASAKLPFGGLKNSGNFRPAAVTMIDSCVQLVSSLTTLDHCQSQIGQIIGLLPE